MNLPGRPLPTLARARQRLPAEKISNVRQHLAEKLDGVQFKKRIRSGDRIAITAGSRGFGGFVELLQGIIDAVKQAGGIPVIIPAMGSHGGATAEGQTELLEALGVTAISVGAPVMATMETICLGVSKSGAEARMDKLAMECAGIVVLGRVKTHPENAEGIASGLLKMTTVGLGKQVGAREAHSHGLWESVRAVPELTLATGKVLCGVAVVENAFREPVALEVVPGTHEAFRDADERLLLVSKKHFARVPFAELDLLIVDEIGKNISGTGMDTNVIGPWRIKGGERKPDYKRIAALSLTAQSKGNGLGIGLADFTTRRFRDAFDFVPTYINLLTATEPGTRNTEEAFLPVILDSDRLAIETALYSSLAADPKICRIRNTADLSEFWISESLFSEVARNPELEIIHPAREVRFDDNDNLF
jgi:hypothetical protein